MGTSQCMYWSPISGIFTELASTPIQSSSCDVCLFVCYFEASYWSTLVIWWLSRFLIGQSTRVQNWVHPHNSLCVDQLNFDLWCTLNWTPGHHRSHNHIPGLLLVKALGVKKIASTQSHVHPKVTPTWISFIFWYQCYFTPMPRDSVSPVCGIVKTIVWCFLNKSSS